MIRTPSTTNGSAASSTITGPVMDRASLFHWSPVLPPSELPSFPFTEFTRRTKFTFRSESGAVQTTAHSVWSLPASVCPTSLAL